MGDLSMVPSRLTALSGATGICLFGLHGGQARAQEQVRRGSRCGAGAGAGTVSVVPATAFANAPQAITQAVVQSVFSNGGSPAAEAVAGDTRFTYYPEAPVSGGTQAASLPTTADNTLQQTGGQFYVMMTPPDIHQSGTPRTIAPRTHPYTTKVEGTRTPRDEKRRAQHNEVERRRRDKINNWIVTLSKIIPDCSLDSSKSGASKGGILSKACDYICDLRSANQRLQEGFKEVERIQLDNELLRQQIEELKSENCLLRAQLQQHGIEAASEAAPQ
ncbi:upstream stimulatory factor 2 [Engraulis encrasicolus]|uniref:upstream stimulatory factor 2 n=1 Tax=Engraulis encrasicolus TaxID=184585 RepID=UPI002FD708D8